MSAVAMKRISEQELQRIYSTRFGKNLEYRRRVWNILVSDFFQKYHGELLATSDGVDEFAIAAAKIENRLFRLDATDYANIRRFIENQSACCRELAAPLINAGADSIIELRILYAPRDSLRADFAGG